MNRDDLCRMSERLPHKARSRSRGHLVMALDEFRQLKDDVIDEP